MKTLSVCIIAKNEQNNLPRCIGSIEHIADEVIVVDTGSTDSTAMLAKGFGANVIHHPFKNNFSEVRNIALENATCDWILYIDCDEMVDFEGGFELKELIQNTEKVGICLTLSNIVDGVKCLSCPSLRVIKNNEGFHFTGRIHEQILPSIHVKYSDSDVLTTGIGLYHYGYDTKVADMSKKHKRNLDIFATYPEEEKDGFYYYNLACQYLSVDDFTNAIENYQISLTHPDNVNGYKIYIPIYITKAYYDMRQFKNASDSALRFIKDYPTFKDLHFLAGASFYEQHDYIRAKGFFLNFIELSKHDYGYPDYNLAEVNNIPQLIKELDEKILKLYEDDDKDEEYEHKYMIDILNSRFFVNEDNNSTDCFVTLPTEWWSRLYEYEWAKNFVSSDDICLDAACGVLQPFKIYLSSVCDNVYACDLDPDLLNPQQTYKRMLDYFSDEEFRKSIPYLEKIRFSLTNLVNLPYKDDFFTKVFCISVLEHMSKNDMKLALKEFYRVMKKDGYLVLTIDYPSVDLETLTKEIVDTGFKFAGDLILEKPENAIYSPIWGGLNCFRLLLIK